MSRGLEVDRLRRTSVVARGGSGRLSEGFDELLGRVEPSDVDGRSV